MNKASLTIPHEGDRVWVQTGQRKAAGVVISSINMPVHQMTPEQQRYRGFVGFFAVRFDSGKHAGFMHAKTYNKKWGFIR